MPQIKVPKIQPMNEDKLNEEEFEACVITSCVGLSMLAVLITASMLFIKWWLG